MSDEPSYPPMDRLADLQKLIADFAHVLRVPHLPGTDRRESDVEHSFGLAVTCWYLAPKMATHLDLSKILRYALAHDFVEVHSGDTFAFDRQKVKSKHDREAKALRKLKDDWEDFPELTEFAAKYAEKNDAEAKFVYAVDKILPAILTKLQRDGLFFETHKITQEIHEIEKSVKMKVSEEVAPYITLLNEWMLTPDIFYKPEQTS